MNRVWTNELTVTFIELYQGEPVVWDPTHAYHKDKKFQNDAWVRISEILDIPVYDLKKKKDSLMATFRSHLRKKKASIKSGAGVTDIYKPIWFAYDIMEAFLGPVYDCKATINTESQNETMEESVEQDTEVYEEADEEVRGGQDINNRASVPTSSTTRPTAVTPSIVRTTANPSFAFQKTVRKRGNAPELEQAGKQMQEAFVTLNSVINRKPPVEEDECDLYGKMHAKKLRTLPANERQFFMYDIDGMFVNRLRCISASPRTSTSSASPLPSPSYSDPPTTWSAASSTFPNMPNRSLSRQQICSQSLVNASNDLSRPTSSCSSYSEPTYILQNNWTPAPQRPDSVASITILAQKPFEPTQDLLSQACSDVFIEGNA